MRRIYVATFTYEDNTYYARVPDLPGCITTGKTLDEAIDLITDAANLWAVAAEDEENPIPEAVLQRSQLMDQNIICAEITVDTVAYRLGEGFSG